MILCWNFIEQNTSCINKMQSEKECFSCYKGISNILHWLSSMIHSDINMNLVQNYEWQTYTAVFKVNPLKEESNSSSKWDLLCGIAWNLLMCSRWELRQRPIPGQYVNVRDLGMFSPKWDVFIKSLTSGLRIIYKKGGRKIVRARGDGWHQGNSVFQAQQDWWTETVAAVTRPAQIQASWGPIAKKGK